ncbi:MAG TPA: exodeoxyribonuclease VII large subunit [Candidatus Limnocylindrales bacterium]|jgi:exodeoxyribonuclease VII large subunit|nr:exodeoxyribonuclease VII large subunit [Candidatus Limnocylindrales bacterium]
MHREPRPIDERRADAAPSPDWTAYAPGSRGDRPGSSLHTSLAGPRIRTVGDVTRLVRDRLRAAPDLRDLWVEGEVGQVSLSAAGHVYFTLRDGRAQLSCVLFRDERRFAPIDPRTGLRIVAHGRIDVFEGQGAYQLYVDRLQPAGFGDLALRLEALKARLQAEGLFDVARKRPLPARPRRIGVVTSAQGAVLHDIRKVLARRWPLVRVVLAACKVQGEAAPATIVTALRRLARWRDESDGSPVDLVILARGGGSLEDLWPFNDERVVRAVADYPVPTVVGVGHETDVTLVEFAADVRAPTPSVAAELCVPDRAAQLTELYRVRARLDTLVRGELGSAGRELAEERRAIARLHPAAVLLTERERVGALLDRAAASVNGRLAVDRARLDRQAERLPAALARRLAESHAALNEAGHGLAALGPYATLERGYAIVRQQDGAIVRDAATVTPGDALDVRLARGRLDVRVEQAPSEPSRPPHSPEAPA